MANLAIVDPADCEGLGNEILGVGADGGLFTCVGIAASIRRAASFLCPATPRQLIDAVLEVLSPLRPSAADLRNEIAETLDLLIGNRDLVELRQGDTRAVRLVYLGPPTFVELEPGRYLVAGIRPFGQPLFELNSGTVANDGANRSVVLDGANPGNQLSAQGLQQVSRDTWVGRPASETAGSLLDRVAVKLDMALPAPDATQIRILDPEKPVRFYKARWRDLTSADSDMRGIFVARREQEYGADLWCAVRIIDGSPRQLLDFPIDDPVAPGRDEAWRLQAAIDADHGTPQQYRVTEIPGPESKFLFEFFSPLPGWAERRVQLVGERLDPQRRALFAFAVSTASRDELRGFLDESLWMDEFKGEVSP